METLQLRKRTFACPIAQEKVRRRVTSAKVVELNAPRPGKKAVVLDIDYTIFDLNSAAERPEARCATVRVASTPDVAVRRCRSWS